MFKIITEIDLVERLRNGEKSAFEELYNEYFKKMHRYVLAYTLDRTKSDDIVQQVMLRIWEKRESLNITTSLQHYLFRSCYNEFLNVKKRNERLSPLDELALQAYEEKDGNEEEFLENLKKIKLAMAELPPKCLECFTLNKLRGLRYREVAEQLGISEKTVEKHISNALKKIRSAVN